MSTVTIPRADVTSDEVSAALSEGLGPRYDVQPGMKAPLLGWGEPEEGQPDDIVVGTGTSRVWRAQVRIDRQAGQTRIRVAPAGLIWIRLINTFGVARKARRALLAAPDLGSGPGSG
jgi:hypothetical protein